MTYLKEKNTTTLDNPANAINNQIAVLTQKLLGESANNINQIKVLARKAFDKNGLPKPKDEEYRYTDIVSSLKQAFDFSSDLPTTVVSDIDRFQTHPIYKENVYIIGLINGQMTPELCVLPDKKTGIIITTIEEGINTFPKEVESVFGQIANIETDSYVSMNTMLTKTGIFLQVKENVVPDKPIVFMNFIDSSKGNAIIHPHNICKIGEHSEVSIIELYEESGTFPVFTNSVTEILADNNSKIHHFKLQNFHDQNIHIDNTTISAQRDAVINTYTFSFKGKIIRNNLNILLGQEHSEAHLYGLYIANNKSLIDNHTIVDHKAPKCFSNEKYKGIMDDYSKGVFNGKIYVRPNAQTTNAFQSNHNILLSTTAKIYAKPQLEIWADDVKCTHGCTTGQINKDHLFYLRSRGISEHDARTLLLQAFASDIMDKVNIPFLKARISRIIKTRLHPQNN